MLFRSRLILRVLGVVMLVVGSVAAMADQSGKLVGIHEIPPFVLDRVELTPGVAQPASPPAAS